MVDYAKKGYKIALIAFVFAVISLSTGTGQDFVLKTGD